MSPVTVFTQSLGYNVIFCVFEKGANNILFSIPPYPQKDPQMTPQYPLPGYGLPGTLKTDLLTPQNDPPGMSQTRARKKNTPFFQKLTFFFSPYVDFAIITQKVEIVPLGPQIRPQKHPLLPVFCAPMM